MHDARARTATGSLTVTLTLLGWTSVPLFLRYFADSIDAWTSNGWRYGFSALLWAPLLVVGHFGRRLPPGLWKAALVPSFVNALGQVCFTWAHYKIDPGLLSFGLRSHMVFAAVGAYLMFAVERPVIRSRGYLGGMVAVLVGTAGAVLLGREPVAGPRAFGITLSIVSGGLFAGYALAVRRYMSSMSSVIAFAAISQYTAAAMVALMLVFGRQGGLEAAYLPGSDLVLLLISAIVGIALGHVLYYMSIARLGVAVSSGILQLHPFTVAVASFFIFREVLTAAQWVSGFIAIVGAVLMLNVQGRVSRAARSGVVEAAVPKPAPPPPSPRG
ncbi:MAG: DMT family transporter [Planctomycetota bacterium]|jgi:drug/metabolite transporter (DMT)-like permease